MKRLTQSILVVMATSSFTLSYAQAGKKDSAVQEKEIEEVVMTGYMKQSKKTLTNSIASVSDKVLESAPRANVATALQGSVAGVRVVQSTGRPGSTPSIQLRGGTSWTGGGSPLILIDGVPGEFYSLNTEDIDRIDVMKDAAATAVYGARGANGVVLVTTKKGKKGRANINFSAKSSYNFKRDSRLEYMNAAEFVKFNRLAVDTYQKQYRDANNPRPFNEYLTGVNPAATGNNTTTSIYTTMFLDDTNRHLVGRPGWQTMVDPLNPSRTLIFMDNNWSDLYYQPSTTEDYNVSVDGGNDRGTYYASLGYIDDRGVVYGARFRRLSGTLNASYKLKDNVKVSGNVTYTRTNNNPPYMDGSLVFQRAAGIAPTARIYNNNPDGTLSSVLSPGPRLSMGNPLYYNDIYERNNLEQRMVASMQLDWELLPKLNLMVRGSHFNVNNFFQSFTRGYYQEGQLPSNFVSSREASFSTGSTMRNQLTTTLNYRTNFGKHNLDALVGSEYFKQDAFASSAGTKNAATDWIPFLNAGSEANGVPSTSASRYSIGSLFSQVNYDYDGRYLLGLTFRADGTSRLAENNRFDYFPGVSFGWAAHREGFYNNLGINRVMNQFKPRFSYGMNGNIDELSDFGVYGSYSDAGIYAGVTGYRNQSIPNYALRWEKAASLNMGLDLGLFSNRITVTADYFIKDVYNKIAGYRLPAWTGYSSVSRNIGTLRVKGFELDVKARVIDTENFKWNVGGNFYTFRNYAVKLAPSKLPGNAIDGTIVYDEATGQEIRVGGLIEGQRVGYGEVVAYIFDGVYKTQEEVDAANNSGHRVTFARNQLTRFLGDAKWKDLNGDNIIDGRDRRVLGRTIPKFTGGFNTDVTYKDFSLYVRTDFAVGHLAYNQIRERGLSQVQGTQNGFKEVTQTWTPENPNSDIPRYVFTDPAGNHKNGSDRLWEKGDYLAIREVTLSYNFRGALVNNFFKNMKIYVTGGNLAYITPFSGGSSGSSEIGGVDEGRFPLPTTITFGVNATF